MSLYTEILLSSEYSWGKDKDVPLYELEISSHRPLCLAQMSTVPFIMAAVHKTTVPPLVHSEI